MLCAWTISVQQAAVASLVAFKDCGLQGSCDIQTLHPMLWIVISKIAKPSRLLEKGRFFGFWMFLALLQKRKKFAKNLTPPMVEPSSRPLLMASLGQLPQRHEAM